MRATTRQREWWGWFGSMAWLFFMMYGHDAFLYGGLHGDEGSLYPFVFMAVFALSVAAFGWRYGRDPEGLARLAFFMTPAAIAITAAFPLLPQPWGSVLYALAPVCMAPAITRRVYGVIQTAEPGRRRTRYMSGIAACVTAFAAWMFLAPPKKIAFLIPALLAVPAWAGVRGRVGLPEAPPETGAFRLKKRLLLLLAAAVVLLFWLDHEHAVIHTHFLLLGEETSQPLFTAFGLILPQAGFLLFAWIADKGHERTGFIAGMGLFLVGLLSAYLPEGAPGAALLPLFVADGLGGTYLEFLTLTAPLFLYGSTRRPVFTASLGVALNLAGSALGWIQALWMPAPLLKLGAPLVVSCAALAIVFIVLAFLLFERCRETTLAAALYALLREDADAPAPDEAPPESAAAREALDAGLTPEEAEVALLLLEGNTRSDILRKLRISAAEAGKYEDAIRHKILQMNEPDPVTAAAIEDYGLTRREAQILRCLRQKMTNPEIAAALFITEATVKVHVHNLLTKLNIENRRGIEALAETFGKQG